MEMEYNRKQVNIIVNSALEAKMVRLANRVGVSGYSITPMRTGQGSTGLQTSSSEGDSNILFMMIITLDKMDQIITEIQKIKDRSYPLRVFINDTYVMDEKDFH
jgi:hypothetical protein